MGVYVELPRKLFVWMSTADTFDVFVTRVDSRIRTMRRRYRQQQKDLGYNATAFPEFCERQTCPESVHKISHWDKSAFNMYLRPLFYRKEVDWLKETLSEMRENNVASPLEIMKDLDVDYDVVEEPKRGKLANIEEQVGKIMSSNLPTTMNHANYPTKEARYTIIAPITVGNGLEWNQRRMYFETIEDARKVCMLIYSENRNKPNFQLCIVKVCEIVEPVVEIPLNVQSFDE